MNLDVRPFAAMIWSQVGLKREAELLAILRGIVRLGVEEGMSSSDGYTMGSAEDDMTDAVVLARLRVVRRIDVGVDNG